MTTSYESWHESGAAATAARQWIADMDDDTLVEFFCEFADSADAFEQWEEDQAVDRAERAAKTEREEAPFSQALIDELDRCTEEAHRW